MAAAEIETTSRAGRRLAWRRAGEGAPLLLLNGYAATGEDWDPTFIGALGSGHELICPDNRGLGASELGDLEREPMTVDSIAADQEAILGHLGIDRVPVVGWSMGGFFAQRLALRSDRVRAMALISTDPGGSRSVPADPAVWGALIDPSGTPREQATRLISILFPADEAAEVDREFGDDVAAARAAIDPRARRAQEAAMDEWHAEEQPLPGPGSPPVLAVCGSDDLVIPAENTRALPARWPTCRVEVLAGCTHALMAQRPRRLAELIDEFLAVRE